MTYNMWDKEPEKLKFKQMTRKQKELLTRNNSFCMLPWMHLHAFPDGRAYPCCFAQDKFPVGDLNKNSLAEVFNNDKMKQLRKNMLKGVTNRECVKCYDQEKSGFFSLRYSSNKHFGHNIGMVNNTEEDGTADFTIKYWDIRFSNLCNFACRSCGTWFSSNWYEDHIKITGSPPSHAKIMRVGRTANDIWLQMLEQFDHVEQFYFAGGEPLIMEEHYRILKELDERKMYHVRLIYNTNFSRLKFKDLDVLELWNKFDSVSVGASLDAEGPRGELMRTGTKWNDIVNNRKKMIEICPKVDFYISATVGLLNSLHVSDFHRNWVELGLIKPPDFNFNLLQYPTWQRMDLLPIEFKDQIKEKWKKHIQWLMHKDLLTRATKGFQSGLDWIYRTDNSEHLPMFFRKTKKYDAVRNEKTVEIFPEWKELFEKYDKN
ncbi:MAG: twitch domain-containing radical SAM protein [Flavobacterium sp.]|nr:twitch domain-containing radical SAM protein [Flavobacterium sp.]